jgi:hypothetical protein
MAKESSGNDENNEPVELGIFKSRFLLPERT